MVRPSRRWILGKDGEVRTLDIRSKVGALLAALAVGAVLGGTAHAQDTPAAKPLDVKNQFRNICGFCHEDYGRHTGKGPKLMDSERSDEYLATRIKNGLPGRMAAFGSVYNDDQIRQFVKFIRNLKAGEEPQNPS
jgi:mono/diheme cytochrome c family protein